jgi:hypothetical protein
MAVQYLPKTAPHSATIFLGNAAKEMEQSGVERLPMWTAKSGNIEYTMDLCRVPDDASDKTTPLKVGDVR